MAHFAKIMVVVLLAGMVILTGCAKRPGTSQSSAPAPSSGWAASAGGERSLDAAVDAAGGSGRGDEAGMAAGTGSGAGGPGSDEQGRYGSGEASVRGQVDAYGRPSLGGFVARAELEPIYFDFDSYAIKPEFARVLDANARWLRANPDHLVLVAGHADERGTNEYNLALGERRAKSTMSYLESQGVAASRMTIISYGEERPVCTERAESCWSQNRRAQFAVKGH